MISEAPTSVASSVRTRRKMKTLMSGSSCRPPGVVTATAFRSDSLARPPAEKILRGLKQRADAQQLGVAAELPDQLDPDRQAIGAKATGHADRRVPGHVEWHRPGKPV